MILFFEMLFTIAIKKLVICGHVIAERTYNGSYWQLGSRPSYKITSVLFHMHKIGFHAKLELVKRNGRVLTLSKILIHLNPLCLNF